jgi:hypothetical protein
LALNAEATTETNDHKGLFGSVVVVVFQSAFHSEMYQNDFFYFLKIIFEISASKRSKTYKKI